MPVRKFPFTNGEFYHVYNRGVNRRKIFLNPSDYLKFIGTINYYSYSDHKIRFSEYCSLSFENQLDYFNRLNKKGISIVAFVQMPNHFHFLLKQLEDDYLMNFLRLIQNSYTRYFNLKHGRIGHLFQGHFKAVHVDRNEQLLHLSRYIHLNPATSNIVKTMDELEHYNWSSLPAYISSGSSKLNFITTEPILEQFETSQDYGKFVEDQIGYQRELEYIKHLSLED